jgi:hypothetical protein
MSSLTRVMFACAVIALIFVLMVVIFRSPGFMRRWPALGQGNGDARICLENRAKIVSNI